MSWWLLHFLFIYLFNLLLKTYFQRKIKFVVNLFYIYCIPNALTTIGRSMLDRWGLPNTWIPELTHQPTTRARVIILFPSTFVHVLPLPTYLLVGSNREVATFHFFVPFERVPGPIKIKKHSRHLFIFIVFSQATLNNLIHVIFAARFLWCS